MKPITKSAAERGDRHTGYQSGDASPKRNPFKNRDEKPRREVYPSSEVPHKWAHQTQIRARNPQGNLFFEGTVLYSYRTSYPIAQIFPRVKAPSMRIGDEFFVLIRADRYSVTTAGHINDASRAASHLARVTVPNVVPESRADHRANFDYLLEQANAALKRAQRSMSVHTAEWAVSAARVAHADAAAYSAFFGLRWAVPAAPDSTYDAAVQRARRIENPDPASKDKRERASAARKAAKAATQEYIEEMQRSVRAARRAKDFYRIGAARSSWRLGDAWGEDYEALRTSAVMLRVDGEQIETSWGARIPLAAAPMVWNMVKRAREFGPFNAAQSAYAPARFKPRIGDYPLDRIDADGTLVAGCHTIPYSELASMARTLGLSS
jgi:hypothetical protein